MSDSHSADGGAGRRHPDLAPELRALAQSLLDKLDPAVRLAAARAQRGSAAPGRCQQVWCPVCALAALVQGEQHPLLGIVADHSIALLTLVKALVDTTGGDGGPGAPPPAPSDPGGADRLGPPPAQPGRYQHIPVTVQE